MKISRRSPIIKGIFLEKDTLFLGISKFFSLCPSAFLLPDNNFFSASSDNKMNYGWLIHFSKVSFRLFFASGK